MQQPFSILNTSLRGHNFHVGGGGDSGSVTTTLYVVSDCNLITFKPVPS